MPINQVSQQLNAIVMALAGAERIFRLMDEEPEDRRRLCDAGQCQRRKRKTDREQRAYRTLGVEAYTPGRWNVWIYIPLKGDVVFDDVDFGYNPDKIVLHDVNLYAKPGTEDRLCRFYRSR